MVGLIKKPIFCHLMNCAGKGNMPPGHNHFKSLLVANSVILSKGYFFADA